MAASECDVCEKGKPRARKWLRKHPKWHVLEVLDLRGNDARTTVAFSFGAFFLVVFLMIGLACCCSRSSKKTPEDNEYDHAALSNNDSLDRFSDANKKVSKIDGMYSLYAKARPYGKILLSYLQITGGLSFNLEIAFPPMFTLMGVVSSVVLTLENLTADGTYPDKLFKRAKK
ncbi:hypothetical protein TL16_g11791 [Triparma laevis f. inornata]|uniref:Uncharacterized protein n=1 Tax=Triparma laevis f. inornata TaxID=1714386 RepID=A0A9W7BGV7_9STRA|nr:hypothetical protein TL16_g11791 [Triparma laevis f. inornata]